MAWQTPKTTWAERYDYKGVYLGDYFEAEDYQRIKGNLLYLKQLADDVNQMPAELPDIPDVTVASFGYAKTINALERSIDALVKVSYNPGVQATKTWVGGSAGPRAADLNRIESTCLALYNVLFQQAAARPMLAFELGGSSF